MYYVGTYNWIHKIIVIVSREEFEVSFEMFLPLCRRHTDRRRQGMAAEDGKVNNGRK